MDSKNKALDFLVSSLDLMISKNEILKERSPRFNKGKFLTMMKNVLDKCLESERESNIYEKANQIENQYKKIENLRKKIKEEKKSSPIEKSENEENSSLKLRIESITEEMKSIEWNHTRKETSIKNKLEKKENCLRQLDKAFLASIQIEQQLSSHLKELKSATIKMSVWSKSFMNDEKGIFLDHLAEIMEKKQEQEKIIQNNKIHQINEKLAQEKSDLHELETRLHNLSNYITEISPDPQKCIECMKDITANSLFIKKDIEISIKNRKKKAIEEMRADIAHRIPGIDIQKGNIADVVIKHIEERLKLKEKECLRKIKRKEEIEKKLEEHLEKALQEIKKLERTGSDTLEIIDYLEKHSRIDEEERRKLEEKLSILGGIN